VMPEVVSEMHVLPGNYSPEQGDFAVAGTVRYDLGYAEPGVTAKGTRGSFGERRLFLGYHPETASPASFAAVEVQSTDGFGPSRAASRTSAIAQHAVQIGTTTVRILATGYAGRFDSPGVVRLADIESGRIGRFDTYGVSQGGFSSRFQLVTELSENHGGFDWSVGPYFVLRSLRLRQNYTGYLVRPTEGDTTQQTNESTTVGVVGRYRHHLRVFSTTDAIEAGVSLRNDWIGQSDLDLGSTDDRVLATIVNAKIRALDAGGWLDLSVRPVPRLTIRTGVRVDGLAYGVEDDTSPTNTRLGDTSSTTFSNQLRPPSPGGQARAAMGTHVGPRATVDVNVWEGLHAVASYGEGFRSPQARSLGDGEKTPFTKVRSVEAGVQYGNAQVRGSASVFRTAVSDDLVFDPVTTRNEAVPASVRLGSAIELVVKPTPWLVMSDSATLTRATFTKSDGTFNAGDKLPYVPEAIIRQDVAFTPTIGRLLSRNLVGRLGTGLTGMFSRPQPYGGRGHDVFLVDATAELRLGEIALDLDVLNLLDARWYDSEFTYSANWTRGSAPSLVPERYVTVGAPRTVLATIALYLN
jgi:iron complex outermembrane recepter protein